MGVHVNIAKAKAQLSELVASAVRGEEVIIDRAGKPQVKLVPCDQAFTEEQLRIAAKRRAAFGALKGKFDGFDEALKEMKRENTDAYERKFARP